MRKNFWWLLVTLGVMSSDLLTKYLAYTSLQPYSPWQITPFFNITLAFNKGAAFSFLNNAGGWQHYLFIALALIISIVLMIWLYRLQTHERWQGLAIAFILGGAWGNVYDRLNYGFVIDFLDFHIGQYHWPIFNIADSAICIGAALMLFLSIREQKKAAAEPK